MEETLWFLADADKHGAIADHILFAIFELCDSFIAASQFGTHCVPNWAGHTIGCLCGLPMRRNVLFTLKNVQNPHGASVSWNGKFTPCIISGCFPARTRLLYLLKFS